MYRRGIALLAACAAGAAAWGATTDRAAEVGGSSTAVSHSAPPVSALAHAGLLDQYCAKCHNTVDWAGGVAFDAISADPPAEDAGS